MAQRLSRTSTLCCVRGGPNKLSWPESPGASVAHYIDTRWDQEEYFIGGCVRGCDSNSDSLFSSPLNTGLSPS